jgi:hypothetical protein
MDIYKLFSSQTLAIPSTSSKGKNTKNIKNT